MSARGDIKIHCNCCPASASIPIRNWFDAREEAEKLLLRWKAEHEHCGHGHSVGLDLQELESGDAIWVGNPQQEEMPMKRAEFELLIKERSDMRILLERFAKMGFPGSGYHSNDDYEFKQMLKAAKQLVADSRESDKKLLSPAEKQQNER